MKHDPQPRASEKHDDVKSPSPDSQQVRADVIRDTPTEVIGGVDRKYSDDFSSDKVEKDTKRGNALALALEIRKFEIDLYWKRAAYFWTFIGIAFGGYFAVLKTDGGAASDSVYVINCLGLVFSVGWYFANRGSKFWQQNWERHVDMLEDTISGPLYKTVLDRKGYKFSSLTGPFAFSVSRINSLLSIYVIIIWLFLAMRSISTLYCWEEPVLGSNMILLSILTAAAIGVLYRYGQSGESEDKVGFVRRGSEELGVGPANAASITKSTTDVNRSDQ